MKQTIDRKWTLDSVKGAFEQGQLAQTLGITLSGVRPDGLDAQVTVDQRHLRPDGIANGGLNLTVVETLGSVSACCCIDWEKFNAFGMNVQANHLKPAFDGETLHARSTPVHVGRSSHVWNVDISNEKGDLVTTGRITMMILPRAR